MQSFKRIFSYLLAFSIVFTSFFFFDLGFGKVEAAITTSAPAQPNVTFYVPECIYLNPVNNASFQYYVDSSDASGTLVASSEDTTGNIFFTATGASRVTITNLKDVVLLRRYLAGGWGVVLR